MIHLPYWKPSLLLLAVATVGTAVWKEAMVNDQSAIAETIKAAVAQVVTGINAHDPTKPPRMTPRILSLWNVVARQLLGSKPTERASGWAFSMTRFGKSVSSTKRSMLQVRETWRSTVAPITKTTVPMVC